MKPDKEKGIECCVGAELSVGWNKEEFRDPDSLLSRTGYVIMYAKCPIIWEIRLQTVIAFSTTEAEYIALSQVMKDVLPFMSLMKEIYFVLKLGNDVLKVKSSIFENPSIVHEKNQGTIALTAAPQMRPCTKHISIKYRFFHSFGVDGDIEIKHVDTKEHIADIFTKANRFLVVWISALQS